MISLRETLAPREVFLVMIVDSEDRGLVNVRGFDMAEERRSLSSTVVLLYVRRLASALGI